MPLGKMHDLTVPLYIGSANVNLAALKGIFQTLGDSAYEKYFYHPRTMGVSVELGTPQLFRDPGTSCHQHETLHVVLASSSWQRGNGRRKEDVIPTSPHTVSPHFPLTRHLATLRHWGWETRLSRVSKERNKWFGECGLLHSVCSRVIGCLRMYQIVHQSGSHWP